MTPIRPKLVICSKDSIFTHDFVKQLTAQNNVEIVGVLASSRIKKKDENKLFSILSILWHSGLTYALYMLKVTMPGFFRPPSRRWQALKIWAKKWDADYLTISNINDPSICQKIQMMHPDYVISVHFNQIFGAEFLSQITCPVINIHPGALPDYRGLDPTFYSLLNEEAELGISVHLVDKTIDTGQLLKVASLPNHAPSLLEATRQSFRTGAILLEQYLIQPSPPLIKSGQGHYYSWPSRSELAKFKKKHRLV